MLEHLKDKKTFVTLEHTLARKAHITWLNLKHFRWNYLSILLLLLLLLFLIIIIITIIIIIIIIIFFYYLFLLLLLNIGHALRIIRIFQKTLQHKTGGLQINVILLWINIILTPRHPSIKYILSKLTFISHYLQYLLSIFWFIIIHFFVWQSRFVLLLSWFLVEALIKYSAVVMFNPRETFQLTQTSGRGWLRENF